MREGGKEREATAAAGLSERLDSWKEIAAYLRRGARTVQRWEQEEGLPVHRLQHEKLGSVYAWKSELDDWWQARQARSSQPAAHGNGDTPSIAVLPFSDLTKEKDQDYFCDGIAEELIGALGRIRGMRVSSRMASFRYRPDSTDLREAARRLKVRNLLLGSVRKSGGRVRISVELTETQNGFQVWSEAYDRELEDIFDVQAEIARSVARQLAVALTPQEHESLDRKPTSEMRAYDCYLKGRKFYYSYGPSDMDYAIQLFTRATELDPEYATAWAGIADCWSYIYLNSRRSPEVLEKARAASRRALELDPRNAQAHASHALAASLSGGGTEVEEEFETAVRLDPRLYEAYYFYARHSFASGDIPKAVGLYEQAMEVRPEDYQAPLLVAQSHETLGNPEKARECRERGIRLAETHLQTNPDDIRAIYMAANGMAALGDKRRALEWVRKALAIRPGDSMLLYNAGCIFSLAGQAEEAIECLEKALDAGLTHRGWYEHDSNLDLVRMSPRFQALLARLPG